MNILSNRILNMAESETLAMTAKARELKAQGKDVISLSIGEPDFNTPEDSELYLALMDEAGVRDAKYEAAVLVRNCSTFFGYQVAPDPENTELCVDHLFVNDQVDVRLFNEVIGHDVQNASDHIPIYIDIDLK